MSALRVAAAAVALAALAGCSSGGGLDDGPGNALPGSTAPVVSAPVTTTPPVTVSPSPTTPTKAPASGFNPGRYVKDPAVQGFSAYVTARFAAFQRRDTRYAPLLRLSTSNRVSFDRAIIEEMIRDGERYEGKIRFAVVAAATTGTRARLRACERDDASWFVSRNGQRSPVKPRWLALDVRMVRVDGVWKVDSIINAKFSCGEAR